MTQEINKESQEAPCWLCLLPSAIQGKCAYHRLEPILGHVRSMAVDLESITQNRQEWERRALKAESEISRLQEIVEGLERVAEAARLLHDFETAYLNAGYTGCMQCDTRGINPDQNCGGDKCYFLELGKELQALAALRQGEGEV